MKKVISLFLLFFILTACGEDGVTITVGASSSYTYNISSSVVNNAANFEFSGERSINPDQIFNESAEQIVSIELDKMIYSITGYQANAAETETMTFTIQSRVAGTINDLAQVNDVTLENVSEAVLFEDGNANSILSAAQVASLEATLDNFEPFDLIVSMSFSKAIDSDFTVEVSWDLVASVSDESDN